MLSVTGTNIGCIRKKVLLRLCIAQPVRQKYTALYSIQVVWTLSFSSI